MVRIEHLVRFDIRSLSKYLVSSSVLEGNGSIKGKLAFAWRFDGGTQSISLEYFCNGVPYNYDIAVERRSSNLGIKGSYYYFICPETGRRCRILYLYEGKFVSRHAIPAVMYKSQMYAVKDLLFKMIKAEDLEGEPYRKEYYKGKITPYGKKVNKAWERIGGSILREVARGGEYGDIFRDTAEELEGLLS